MDAAVHDVAVNVDEIVKIGQGTGALALRFQDFPDQAIRLGIV
jgi:hypothetical protein